MDDLRCDCLESVVWSIFNNSAANLNKHATIITDFISKHVEHCMPKKLIQVFPNRKPWMNREIHSLGKSRSRVSSRVTLAYTGNLEVPNCFRKIMVLKKNQATCLSDHYPVALATVIMKCFK
eukprot:g33285.t1